MRLKLCAIILILLTTLAAYGQSENGISPETAEKLIQDLPWLSRQLSETLIEKGEYTNFYTEKFPTPVVSRLPGMGALEKDLKKVNPTIGVEASFIIETDKEITDQEFMHMLSEISTMKGVKYFSASRGEVRVLFEESHRVARKDNQNKLADAEFTGEPLSITIYQQDPSFGGNYYSLDYTKSGNGYRMSMQNLNQMYYAVLPVVGEKSLAMEMYIEKHEGYIFFYGNCAVNAFTPFGMAGQVQASFYNRIKAISDWFSAKVK